MTPREGAALRVDSSGPQVEAIEIKLLLEAIELRYGYDFREYALSPLRRGLFAAMARERVSTVSAYQEQILRDAGCLQRFLGSVGVNVTGMFRDADMMRAVREEVVPELRTYPSVRVWVAGCATGEEAYAFAVLLEEEGLLDRCAIYATDLNEDVLDVARTGAYPLERVRRYEEGYMGAGGRGQLSDHYEAVGRSARFDRKLAGSITWSRHNLVNEGSFNDFHLIACANVLIYFRASLQVRAHRLLYDSLVRGGFLALGKRESLVYCPDRDHYAEVRPGVNLFRKTRW